MMTLRTLALLFAFVTSPALANDDAELYDAVPPKDAAFLRIIYAGDQGEIEASVSGKPLGEFKELSIGEYHMLSSGDHSVIIEGSEAEVLLDSGEYYSYVIAGGKSKLIEDASPRNPAKAMMYAYNLTQKPVTFSSPEHDVVIFRDLAPLQGTSREINAVQIALEALHPGNEVAIASYPEALFERRNGYSYVVAKPGEVFRAAHRTNAIHSAQ